MDMAQEISLKSIGDRENKLSVTNPVPDLEMDDFSLDTKVDAQDDDFGKVDQVGELSENVQKAIRENSDGVCDTVQQWLSMSPQSVNARDSEERTALHLAAAHCNAQVAEILLKAGADPTLVDDESRTVLHCLCNLPDDENITDFVDLICNRATDVDAVDATGRTALHYAAKNGHLDVVIKLLDMGADMCIKDGLLDETPVHLAATGGHHEILAEMIKRNSECVQLTSAPNSTPLHLAAFEGHPKAVRVILGSPCTPNVNARSKIGEMPLHSAAIRGSTEVARLLLEHGAELNPPDTEKTPFHTAAYYGQTDLALFLLGKGAKVTVEAFKDVLGEGYENIARVVMESDQWPLALRGTYEDRHHKQTTPFRELIKKMPAVAEMVLDHCVMEKDDLKLNRQDHDYSVLYNYEFLEDCHEDAGPERRPLHEAEVADCSERKTKGTSTYGCSYAEIRDRPGDFCPTWGPQKYSNVDHPLKIMVQRKELNLLRHPVVASLLHYKWKKFGLISYIANLLTYVVFLSFLTAFALLVPNPQSSVCISSTNRTESICPGSTDQLGIFLIVSSVIVLLMGGSRLIFEIIQLIFQRLSYITDWVNWVESAQYICSIIFVVVYGTDCFCVIDWQWQVGVVAVFLGWINLILFVSKLPFVGIYVIILIKICVTFVELLVLTLLLIVAFGLPFYMTFFDLNALRSPFSDVPRSFLKTMTMTTGELDYDAIFRLDPAGESDDLQEIEYPPISYVIWILFLVVMPVIFTNMLTSLAVGDTNTVREEAQLQKLALQVDQVLAMEKILAIFRKCVPRKWRRTKSSLKIRPNLKNSWLREMSFRLWEGDRYDQRDVIMKVVKPPEAESEEILKRTNELSEDVKAINKKLLQFQFLLEEIAKRNGIENQASLSVST